MTLLIAYMLMAQVDVHWITYPFVFALWLVHLGFMKSKWVVK